MLKIICQKDGFGVEYAILKKGGKAMKKILIALIALTFVTSLCLAAPESQAKKSTEELKTFVGKVASLEYADPTKGLDANNMKVVGPDGNPISFSVSAGVTVLDAATRVITLNQLKIGDSVKIEKVNKGGKEEVKSIQKTK